MSNRVKWSLGFFLGGLKLPPSILKIFHDELKFIKRAYLDQVSKHKQTVFVGILHQSHDNKKQNGRFWQQKFISEKS